MSQTPRIPLVLAFDLGKASIGEATRFGNEFVHIASWLMPCDLAPVDPQLKPAHLPRATIEFVRTDFMGPKAKLELAKFQNDRAKVREESRAKATKLGAEGRASLLKYELWKAQGGICLFTGEVLPVF